MASSGDTSGSASRSEVEEVGDENKLLLGDQESSGGNGSPRRAAPPTVHRDSISRRMKLAMDRTFKGLRRMLILSTRLFSMSEESYATLMAFISSMAIMGIVSLNIYSASYFLAWKKVESVCHVFPDSTSSDEANAYIQLIIVALPFACLPLALCIGSLAEVTKNETRYLGFVAFAVMFEMIYVVSLGAVMTLCMSNVPGKSVLIAAALTVFFLLLFWGCCCRYPKCWRHAVFCKCCCPDIDEAQVEELV